MASKAETFWTKKWANGFILGDHEHDKSELINMTKNCDFSQFLLNRQLALNFSDYYKELRKIATSAKNRQTCDFSQHTKNCNFCCCMQTWT